MLDNLTSRNHIDFKQRYQGTFGFLVQDEKKHLVYVSHVDSRQAKFVDVKKNEYYVYADGEHTFEFIQVTRGWFNTKTGLFYVTRIPQRQWHRGICTTNTEIYSVVDNVILDKHVDIKALQAIFEEEIEVQQAFTDFVKKARTGFALSRHFAITSNVFYFDNKIVGKVEMGEIITITLSHDIVYQEIMDTIRRNNFSGNIVLKKGTSNAS